MRPVYAALLLLFTGCAVHWTPLRNSGSSSAGNGTIEVTNTSAEAVELMSGTLSLGTLAPHETREFAPNTPGGSFAVRLDKGGTTVTRSCSLKKGQSSFRQWYCPMSSQSF